MVFIIFIIIKKLINPLLKKKKIYKLNLKQIIKNKNKKKNNINFKNIIIFLIILYTRIINIIWFIFIYKEKKVKSL